MGHCLHKADAFPKDMFCLVCENEMETEQSEVPPPNKADRDYLSSHVLHTVAKWLLEISLSH